LLRANPSALVRNWAFAPGGYHSVIENADDAALAGLERTSPDRTTARGPHAEIGL